MVSDLAFKSLGHFQFISVYGIRSCPVLVFLCSCPVYQYHLVKRLSFHHCMFLPPLSKINWPQKCGFIWIFCSVSFILASVFCTSTLPFWLLYLFDSLKSRSVTSQAFLFFLKVPLSLWGLLCSWPGFGIRIRLSSYNEFGSILLLQLFKMIWGGWVWTLL